MSYIGNTQRFSSASSVSSSKFSYPGGVTETATDYIFPVKHTPGNVLVFVRGFHLGEEDYTAVDGNNVRIKKSKLSLAVGDVIECLGHNVQTDTSIRQAVSTSTFTQAATPTRTIGIANMHAGSAVLIFYKGIHLQEGTDYTRSDSQITLSNSIAISTGDTCDATILQPITNTEKSIDTFFYTQPTTPSRSITVANLADEDNVLAYYNRGLWTEGTDFTRSGSTITIPTTFSVSPNDILEIKIFKGHESYSKHAVTFTSFTFVQPVSPTRTITPTGGLTNSIMVYYNGIMLKETNDYTVSGGTITLDSNLTVAQNDIVDVKIFSTFMSDSAMPQTGGQFYKFGVPQYNNVSDHNNTVEIETDKGMMVVGPVNFTGTVNIANGAYLTIQNQADFQNTLTCNGTLKII